MGILKIFFILSKTLTATGFYNFCRSRAAIVRHRYSLQLTELEQLKPQVHFVPNAELPLFPDVLQQSLQNGLPGDSLREGHGTHLYQ